MLGEIKKIPWLRQSAAARENFDTWGSEDGTLVLEDLDVSILTPLF